MNKTGKILVIGACGQIGSELTSALRERYGNAQVIAGDRLSAGSHAGQAQPYVQLDVLDKAHLSQIVADENITQIYHLAAVLSATGEKEPQLAWQINMQGLLNVLDIAVSAGLEKVFWPSSIAVFGPDSPKKNCPQQAVTEPTTVYGISKCAGEYWCNYYHQKFGLDVRSLRFPGLISYLAAPGGGTTDYAVDIFHKAVETAEYECYLEADTPLPMMYMHDAIRATLELMDANAENIGVRTSYNLAGLSFTPAEIAQAIKKHIPGFRISYAPDFRQQIAESWPGSIDDSVARKDWGWKPKFDLEAMVEEMLKGMKITV
ncbi:L-threonine 3-dehydrogenase [Arcticibacter pallidicorallinus]|uniref:L-threonine 3-dehydrogenase n=1 Tax=Arcticibacter pallidicorallinus TaxID=1259464 RepID=A0A2T0TYW0_9SPHI|nr:NAD-dependent epimerase/dehydratase family protein [Arcticibacter pallidicorallinus]PRY50833.1 L-threonine 3-dehydrogenase [Arcticibacter pallidicorallinus]